MLFWWCEWWNLPAKSAELLCCFIRRRNSEQQCRPLPSIRRRDRVGSSQYSDDRIRHHSRVIFPLRDDIYIVLTVRICCLSRSGSARQGLFTILVVLLGSFSIPDHAFAMTVTRLSVYRNNNPIYHSFCRQGFRVTDLARFYWRQELIKLIKVTRSWVHSIAYSPVAVRRACTLTPRIALLSADINPRRVACVSQ